MDEKGLKAQEQIEELASFVLKHFHHEIGMGNPRDGESAVEVAIRLLKKRYNIGE